MKTKNLYFFLILFLSNSIFTIYLDNIYAQVNIEKFREHSGQKGFSGYVEMDISSRTGNVEITKIDIEARCDYRRSSKNTFIITRGDYGWKGSEQFSNEALAHLRHIIILKGFYSPEFFTQVGYNKERMLSFRYLTGSGLRFKLINQENIKLGWGSSLMFEHEKLDIDEHKSHKRVANVFRWSNYIVISLTKEEKINFSWTIYFQPQIDNFEDTRILSETNLTISIMKNLSFVFGFRMRYDSLPPDNVKKLDTALKTGLAFRF